MPSLRSGSLLSGVQLSIKSQAEAHIPASQAGEYTFIYSQWTTVGILALGWP